MYITDQGNYNPLRYFSRKSTYCWRGHLKSWIAGRDSNYPFNLLPKLLEILVVLAVYKRVRNVSYLGKQQSGTTLSAKTFLTIPFWERVG